MSPSLLRVTSRFVTLALYRSLSFHLSFFSSLALSSSLFSSLSLFISLSRPLFSSLSLSSFLTFSLPYSFSISFTNMYLCPSSPSLFPLPPYPSVSISPYFWLYHFYECHVLGTGPGEIYILYGHCHWDTSV